MGHVALLGDSIFDNASYVPGQPAVIDQLRQALPTGWAGSLCALDGAMTDDVGRQLKALPADATHLVISVGGNDALSESAILHEPACTVGEALETLRGAHSRFAAEYRAMLKSALAVGKPTAVCTVYDSVPRLGVAERAALAGFNEVILREAFANALPIVDLRLTCDQAEDYSSLSLIEPSAWGGAKIVRAIATLVSSHDFGSGRSTVYF